MKPTRVLAVLAVVLAVPTSGCWKIQQAAERARRNNDLKQLVILYHNYHDAKDHGPANADEFMAVAADSQEQALIQAAKDGQYVVIWGVSLGEVAKGNVGMSGTVLAYEKEAPTAGGMVAMVDGTVLNMTAAEFQATPKASPAAVKPAENAAKPAENKEKKNPPVVKRPEKQPPPAVRKRDTQENELKEIGKYYLDFAAGGRAPSKIEDLTELKKQAIHPCQKVKLGVYVLTWNADVNDAPAGTANTILGYEKEAPNRGGAVLMLDGSAKTLTAREFQETAKAKTR
jgi:hypothetical protein